VLARFHQTPAGIGKADTVPALHQHPSSGYGVARGLGGSATSRPSRERHRIGRQADQEPRPTTVSAGFNDLFRRNLYGYSDLPLVPASTAVPAAAAQEYNDDRYNE
jgi:hypothetical protein